VLENEDEMSKIWQISANGKVEKTESWTPWLVDEIRADRTNVI
jgi:hypothetical protein